MLEYSQIDIGAPDRRADLCRVVGGRGLVLFAHADAEARSSWRSDAIAQRLQRRDFSTLVFDLLAADEAGDAGKAHDVDLLTERLLQAIDALPPAAQGEPIGLLGSDVGAAAALVAQTRRPQAVKAIVTCSGYTDLAGAKILSAVRAPTLLIVGAADAEVLAINRQAYAQLGCEHKRIETVPRATRLFREAGAIETVARCTTEWFATHLLRA